jgi:hypothetical protein
MRTSTLRMIFGVLLVLALFGILRPATVAAGEDVPRITKEEAKALLGAQNVVFIDARTDAAWGGSDRKIKGAVRLDRYDPDALLGGYARDTKFIVY